MLGSFSLCLWTSNAFLPVTFHLKTDRSFTGFLRLKKKKKKQQESSVLILHNWTHFMAQYLKKLVSLYSSLTQNVTENFRLSPISFLNPSFSKEGSKVFIIWGGWI